MQNQSSEEALLNAVKDLIAIESTAENPAGLLVAYEYMRNMILDCNKDITIEEFEKNGKPSFLAYRGDERPDTFQIILNAHVDVVPGKPDQYEMKIIDGNVYGRGVYDMKAAAIVFTRVFCDYIDKVPYALGLQIVTDEEPGGLDGTLHQVEQGVRTNLAICGECGRRSNTYEIANETKGIVFADVRLNGKSSHGAYPWQGDNTALHASQFVQALHNAYPSPHTESPNSTITVTGISSTAGVYNKTPEEALVMLDCRFTPEDEHFSSKQAFKDFIGSVDKTASVTAFHIFSEPMQSDPNNKFLHMLKTAAEQVEGHSFSYARRHAGSDGRHYLPYGGQACEFGIAGEDQHGVNEHITIESFHNYVETMRVFMQKTISEYSHRGELLAVG